MSHFLFDLNIYNYSIDELKTLLKLDKNYNNGDIQKKISDIKNKSVLEVVGALLSGNSPVFICRSVITVAS